METGPIADRFISELEALKWRLAAMESPDDLSPAQADALAAEIGAIRLQLKRLALDRQVVGEALASSLGLAIDAKRQPEQAQ